jgi:hypothetical protein
MSDAALFRLVAVVDMERYSARGNLEQLASQRDLDRALHAAASGAGLDRTHWQEQVGGDGELAVLPADTDPASVIADFTRELHTCLGEINSSRRPDTRLRLRLAVHFGLLMDAPFGPAGSAPVVASRLLNAQPLYEAMADAPGANLALIISKQLYDDIVMSRFRGLDPSTFREVHVVQAAKKFDQVAYIQVPGSRPPAQAELVAPPTSQPDTDIGLPYDHDSFRSAVSSPDRLFELVDSLLEIRAMRDKASREQIIDLLPRQIAVSIARHHETRFDVLAVVRTCLEYPGGLGLLLSAIRNLEGESLAMSRLIVTVKRILSIG